MLESDGSEM